MLHSLISFMIEYENTVFYSLYTMISNTNQTHADIKTYLFSFAFHSFIFVLYCIDHNPPVSST